VKEDFLILYKTGRTNANDVGIDFVMKPLGRFFQVTETLDVRKYFLDRWRKTGMRVGIAWSSIRGRANSE